MNNLQNIEPKEIVNVSYDADENFIKEEGYLTHMIGVITTENNISDQLDVINIDESKWIVFENEGKFPKFYKTHMLKFILNGCQKQNIN